MKEIVERLMESHRIHESNFMSHSFSKDPSSGLTFLYLKFDSKDPSKGVYDYVLDDTYPGAPILKRKLIASLSRSVGKGYPYVRSVLDNQPIGFITPGISPMK